MKDNAGNQMQLAVNGYPQLKQCVLGGRGGLLLRHPHGPCMAMD